MLRRLKIIASVFILIPLLGGVAAAQVEDLSSSNPKVRRKAVKSLGDKGEKRQTEPAILCESVGKVTSDPDPDVRMEAVVALTKTNALECLEPLMAATKDASPEIQSQAVDGLVNFYVPGYVKFGLLSSVKAAASNLKNRLRTPEPTLVENYVNVKPEVVRAIAPLITGGTSIESRANAARAVGILRGRSAIPELKEALQSRREPVVIESLRAVEKIADISVGPDLVFLLRDPSADVQIAASMTTGQLRVREAVPDLVNLVRSSNKDVSRAAMTALAKIPENGEDKLFLLYLRDKDEQMRAAAAEGLGRSGKPGDLKVVQDAFAEEKKETARLSMAFAAVHLGDVSMLQYLVDGLNNSFRRLEARPFLVELARDPKNLAELYTPLTSGTRDQKIHLAHVIARSGTEESVEHMKRLTMDGDSRVAEAAIVELKNLQARLGG